MEDQREQKTSGELENTAASMKDTASKIKNVADRFSSASPAMDSSVGQAALGSAAESAAGAGANVAAGASLAAAGEGAAGTASGLAASAGASAVASGATSAATAAGSGAAASAAAAAGTAVAGPAGTAIGAAIGSVIKPIAKAIAVLCMGLIFMMMIYASFPSIMFKSFTEKIQEIIAGNVILSTVYDFTTGVISFITDSGEKKDAESYQITAESCRDQLTQLVQDGYTKVYNKALQEAIGKGYDEALTKENMSLENDVAANVAYLQAVYSIQTPQDTQSMSDLLEKAGEITYYTYTTLEKSLTVKIPKTVKDYKSVSLTVPDEEDITKTVKKTFYIESGSHTITEDSEDYTYTKVEMDLTDGIEGVTYYERSEEKEKIVLDTKIIKYGEIRITKEQERGIDQYFEFDRSAKYMDTASGSTITNGQWADMLSANYDTAILKKETSAGGSGSSSGGGSGEYRGSYGYQEMEPLTEAQITGILSSLNCSNNRKYLISNALQLVGKVPYFYGGRTSSGWDDTWGQQKTITVSGNNKQPVGSFWPNGLDCSGFVSWVYKTTFGGNPMSDITTDGIAAGTNTIRIDKSQLLPGDIVLRDGHTGIFLGYDADGNMLVIHEAGTYVGCIMGPSNFTSYWRCKTIGNLEGNEIVWKTL